MERARYFFRCHTCLLPSNYTGWKFCLFTSLLLFSVSYYKPSTVFRVIRVLSHWFHSNLLWGRHCYNNQLTNEEIEIRKVRVPWLRWCSQESQNMETGPIQGLNSSTFCIRPRNIYYTDLFIYYLSLHCLFWCVSHKRPETMMMSGTLNKETLLTAGTPSEGCFTLLHTGKINTKTTL